MANPATNQHEPTMEEILASIRRIISEDSSEPAKAQADEPPLAAAEPEEEVLELTHVAPAAPVVAAVQPQPAPRIAVEEPRIEAPRYEEPRYEAPVAPPAAPAPAPRTVSVPAPALEDELVLQEREDEPRSLVSSTASQKGVSAFGALAQNMRIASIDSRTLEDVVNDLVKPMLKDWLERNLPDTVERLVQEEIDRMAKRGRR